MKYLLDTNSVIALDKRHPELTARLRQSPPEQFALSSIVLMELYYGAYKSMKTTENLRNIEKLPFPVLPFTAEDAQRAGRIRTELERLGTPIGNFDLLIAAQTLNHSLTLITHNVREFSRIAALQWEDWLHD